MFTNLPLFSDSASGKSTRQQQFENLYIGFGINLLPVIEAAHDKTLDDASREPPEFIDRFYFAQAMNRNIIGIMKQQYPDLIRYDEAERVFIKLDDKTRVYFKKLDEKYRPSNIPTGHVAELNSAQGRLFGKELTVLYIGPRLRNKKVWDDIDCYMVEMRDTKRCEWVSDLSDLASRMGGTVVPIVTPPTPIAPPAVAVRLRSKDQQANNGSAAAN